MFLLSSGFYYKLVTTGNETKDEEIETLPEEADGEENAGEAVLAPRSDVKRKSNRRVHRHHSTKRGFINCITYKIDSSISRAYAIERLRK